MNQQTIYYVFRRSDGEFMGSGYTLYDDATYGGTTVAYPELPDGTKAYWNGTDAWVVPEPEPEPEPEPIPMKTPLPEA